MGVVYKARDTKLDRTVALKFLPQHLAPTEEDSRRFSREAKAAAALNHPNICTTYNIGNHEGRQFISMEYINGETLREKIDGGELTLKSSLNYAIRIADALAEAHQNDIIHRGIKPGNIMIDRKNRVKVMDFGLAKLTGSMDLTKTGSTLGTVPYMSPEQIQGKPVDHRSDLFSLGIVLYEMLTGQKPFHGEHQAAMTYAIVNEEPEPVQRYLLPEAPEELSQIFERLLAKEPEIRISSATEVVDLLEGIKGSADIIPQQSSPAEGESKSKSQDSDSSTIISLTIPTLGFGKSSIGKAGLLASAIAVLALILFTGWWFVGGSAVNNNTVVPPDGSQSEITDRSIAVLPFTNLSETNEVKPITRGLHVDLLTRLSNIADLQVKSPASASDYRGTDLSRLVIADSLGVQWVVEGSVQQSGNQIQVNAQLIDPQTDSYVWSDHYRQELSAENLFAIQEEITGEIADALQAELTEGEQERIADAPTQNLDAYRLYIQGRQLMASREPDSLQLAQDYFKRALRQDSSYALAWTGLADARMLYQEKENNNLDSIRAVLPAARTAIQRALDLNPNLAEAYASKGAVLIYEQLVQSEAQTGPQAHRLLQKAIELKPSYPQAHHWLGELYLWLDQPGSALQHLELALDLNPRNRSALSTRIFAMLANNNYQEALGASQQLQSRYSDRIVYEALALLHLKKWQQVRDISRQYWSEAEDIPPGWTISFPGLADVGQGDTVSARRKLSQADDPWTKATIQAAIGEFDAAFEFYSKSIHNPNIMTGLRYFYPDLWKNFRNDPRYNEMIRELNEWWGLNPEGSIPEEKKTM